MTITTEAGVRILGGVACLVEQSAQHNGEPQRIVITMEDGSRVAGWVACAFSKARPRSHGRCVHRWMTGMLRNVVYSTCLDCGAAA